MTDETVTPAAPHAAPDVLPPAPVQSLAYQLPADAGADPWAAVVRAVGWAAAGYAGAAVLGAICALAFRWGIARGGGGLVDPMLLLTSVARLFYVPVLIGGVACGLLRRGGDAWLRTGLLIVIAVQVLTLLAGGVGMAVTSAQIAGNFGPIGAAGLVGQSFFGTVGQTVPLVLMYWLMTRTGARRVLAAYGG